MENILNYVDTGKLFFSKSLNCFSELDVEVSAAKAHGEFQSEAFIRIVLNNSTFRSLITSDWYTRQFGSEKSNDLDTENGTVSGRVLDLQRARQVLADHFNAEIAVVAPDIYTTAAGACVPYLKGVLPKSVILIDGGEKSQSKFILLELNS